MRFCKKIIKIALRLFGSEEYFKIQFLIKPSVRAKSGDYQIREIKTTHIFHRVDAKLKLKAKV